VNPPPQDAPRERRLLRDDGVAEAAESIDPPSGSVQPAGKPISASTNAGLNWRGPSGGEPSPPAAGVVGAGRKTNPSPKRAIVSRLGRIGPTRLMPPLWFVPSGVADGVGHMAA